MIYDSYHPKNPDIAPSNSAKCYSKPLTNDQVKLYPLLNDYMGLNLTSSEVQHIGATEDQVIAEYVQHNTTSSGMIAPLSGSSVGFKRAQITHGLREVYLCKDEKGKIGIRVKAMNKVSLSFFFCIIFNLVMF